MTDYNALNVSDNLTTYTVDLIDTNSGLNVSGSFSTYTIDLIDTNSALLPGYQVAQGLQPLYRGFLSGEYIYSLGTAPVGATDIVIIGYR